MRELSSIIMIFLTLFMLNACTKYKLTKEDKKWQPYKEGDVLVFKSSKNEIDTIFVKDISVNSHTANPLDVSPYYQGMSVTGEITLQKPFHNSSGHIFNTEFIDILSLGASKDYSSITFSLKKRSDTLKYPSTRLSIRALNSLFKTKARLKYGSIEIEAKEESDLPFNYDLKNYWWSKEFGYVRYEFKNGYYWELHEFVRKGKNILKN